jgi:hypothetical protein
MKTDSLQQFVKLRNELSQEKSSLETRLSQINEALGDLLGTPAAATPSAAVSFVPRPTESGKKGKRTMSPEARARIAAAQKARWAAVRGESKSTPAPAAASNGASVKPKRKMSAAGRKAIAEGARRRWAAAKAAGKSTL